MFDSNDLVKRRVGPCSLNNHCEVSRTTAERERTYVACHLSVCRGVGRRGYSSFLQITVPVTNFQKCTCCAQQTEHLEKLLIGFKISILMHNEWNFFFHLLSFKSRFLPFVEKEKGKVCHDHIAWWEDSAVL